MLHRGGYEEAAGDESKLEEYLRYAGNWAEEWAPESLQLRILEPQEASVAAEELDDEQREYLKEISTGLDPDLDDAAAQNLLYSKAVEREIKPEKGFRGGLHGLAGPKAWAKSRPVYREPADGVGSEPILERVMRNTAALRVRG